MRILFAMGAAHPPKAGFGGPANRANERATKIQSNMVREYVFPWSVRRFGLLGLAALVSPAIVLHLTSSGINWAHHYVSNLAHNWRVFLMAEARLTVIELARASGTAPDTVRYYTRRGLLKPTRDPCNDYRLYRPRDVRRLCFIGQAKRLGYTLGEIHQILEDADRGRTPCPRVRVILQRRIKENRQGLKESVALQRRMEQALSRWAALPDGIPDGDSVCHLIESFDGEGG